MPVVEAPPPAGSTAEPLVCPGCGGTLQVSVTEAHVRYVCSSCGGLLCGIAVLRKLSDDSAARHLWSGAMVAEGDGHEGRCPFCKVPMKASPVPQGRFWTCKTCEMAWLDPEAITALSPPVGRETKGAAASNDATSLPRCATCGAAVQHTWDEQCAFCGAALHPPTKVVVVDRDGDPIGGWVGRL